MPVRLCIGDAVLVYMNQNAEETTIKEEEDIHIGVIKYIGFIHGFDMTEYVGMELVESIENGHSGTINGYQYFSSHGGHGIHTRITNVIRKLHASEVTIKMQEIIMLFKQRMGEYVRAVSERDEYIEELKNTQRNLRRLLKEHNKHIQDTAPSRKFATVISNIESPSFSFVSHKQNALNTFAMFKSTKLQHTESEGDSIASMQTDLSNANVLKLNTIDEIKTTKHSNSEQLQPDSLALGKGLETCSIATPITPITPIDSELNSLQSDSEILHVSGAMESPHFQSPQHGHSKTLKTRYGKITHKKTKLHSRSSSEQTVNFNNNKHEYTKYAAPNRHGKRQKRMKRRLDTETEEETQSASSYDSSWDDPTETETECSEYYEEEYDNKQPKVYNNNNINLYSQARKYKNIKYNTNTPKNNKNTNNHTQHTKKRYLPFKSRSNPNPNAVTAPSQYTQTNNINMNMNNMYVAPDTVYYNQQTPQTHAVRHPSIGSPNNSGHSPSSLGSELPQSFTNPAVASSISQQMSMSAGNLRKLMVYEQNNNNMAMQSQTQTPNTYMQAHGGRVYNNQSKNVRKRQVKFVKPVLELRNHKSTSNEYVARKMNSKDSNHRRSYTWDPLAGGGLIPPEMSLVQNNNMVQAQRPHGHQLQYSTPNGIPAYYQQPMMDEWMQQTQAQTAYFHHN